MEVEGEGKAILSKLTRRLQSSEELSSMILVKTKELLDNVLGRRLTTSSSPFRLTSTTLEASDQRRRKGCWSRCASCHQRAHRCCSRVRYGQVR